MKKLLLLVLLASSAQAAENIKYIGMLDASSVGGPHITFLASIPEGSLQGTVKANWGLTLPAGITPSVLDQATPEVKAAMKPLTDALWDANYGIIINSETNELSFGYPTTGIHCLPSNRDAQDTVTQYNCHADSTNPQTGDTYHKEFSFNKY